MQHEIPPNQTDETSRHSLRPPWLPLPIAILAMLLLAFIPASIFAHQYYRFPGDLTITLHIQAIHNGFITQAMKAISLVGGGRIATILLCVAALLFWVKHMRSDSLLLIGAAILSSSDRLMKILVDRPRPTPDLISVMQINRSGSFPSGHAIFAMAFYGALFYFSTVYITNTLLKRLAQVSTAALILLTGISRIYLGAHWPSDIFGGYLMGGIILMILILLHKRIAISTITR